MRLWISLKSQTLELIDSRELIVRRYAISTASRGAGERRNSLQTPRGRHIVRARIGTGAGEGAVFVGRRPTGETWSPELAAQHPDRDWILSRILWLSGCEPGHNRLGEVDTMQRYIYIHGCPPTAPMGRPASIGCIRMRNADIIDLFEQVQPGDHVDIVEYDVDTQSWLTVGDHAGRVREQVFVVEQGVPADMEYDEFDPWSLHVLARGPDGQAIGTGRLLPDGHIGRLAVLAHWRNRGVGRALMCRLTEIARQRGFATLKLNAQVSAAGFYERLGYRPEGEVFMEAGIPHLAMVRDLPAADLQLTA